MSANRAKLVPTRVPIAPRGVVLVLHGGASREGSMAVSPAQLSVLRMVPIAHRIAHAGRGELAVFRVLNSARGWDTHHTPVDDVRWALRQVRDQLGEVPVSLVGHSLGGRAAILAGTEPEVSSVVALAPWLYRSDEGTDLTGRRVLIVHGKRDHVADPATAATVAKGLAATAEVGFISVRDGKHAMLRRHAEFDRAAADFAAATLLGTEAGGAVGRVLSGEPRVEV